MNENNNNWFYRNRTFLFGFTAVLIVLYIVISMLVPHQTPVAWCPAGPSSRPRPAPRRRETSQTGSPAGL